MVYIYIYIYICMSVCTRVCVCECAIHKIMVLCGMYTSFISVRVLHVLLSPTLLGLESAVYSGGSLPFSIDLLEMGVIRAMPCYLFDRSMLTLWASAQATLIREEFYSFILCVLLLAFVHEH